MTSFSNPSANNPADAESVDVEAILLQLRRKEGNWVAWGQSCQALQKQNYSPQQIFEDTGFEPIHQNQLIVAAQVFNSITTAGVSEVTKAHFDQRDSEILYELRVLDQDDRAAAATYIVQRGLDIAEARELTKAMKELDWQGKPPAGFTAQPGDALAYRYWNSARQTEDVSARSRLIGQGLRHAQSESARKVIEELLTNFAPVKPKQAPRLPTFRLEAAEEMPRIVPVAGEYPLPVDAYKAVPLTEMEGDFGLVRFSATGAWVALPGWQVVMQAEDPVGLLATSEQLSLETNKVENLLLVIDRAQRQWVSDRYFVCDRNGQITLEWFETQPSDPLLGQLILVLQPQKILDEAYTQELWQIDE